MAETAAAATAEAQERETARRAGISHGYLAGLEGGARCPSLITATSLAEVLELTDEECELLGSVAVADAGRSNPLRRARMAP
jgi:predicted transcriptional regulator